MFVKKRITNSNCDKGTLFFVHNLRWVCSRSGKKNTENEKMERRKQKANKSPLKVNKQTTEKIHCSMFLMVDVALIYVTTWRNEERSTQG